jgi:hypothetical protein
LAFKDAREYFAGKPAAVETPYIANRTNDTAVLRSTTRASAEMGQANSKEDAPAAKTADEPAKSTAYPPEPAAAPAAATAAAQAPVEPATPAAAHPTAKSENGHTMYEYVRTEPGFDTCDNCLRRIYAGEKHYKSNEDDYHLATLCADDPSRRPDKENTPEKIANNVPLGEEGKPLPVPPGAHPTARSEKGNFLYEYVRTEPGFDTCDNCLRRMYAGEKHYKSNEDDYHIATLCANDASRRQ